MGRVEVVRRVGGVGAEKVVVEIVRNLAREQRLARVLVPARARESLFVTVVDDGVAAGKYISSWASLSRATRSASSAWGLSAAMKLPIRPMSWFPRKVGSW